MWLILGQPSIMNQGYIIRVMNICAQRCITHKKGNCTKVKKHENDLYK